MTGPAARVVGWWLPFCFFVSVFVLMLRDAASLAADWSLSADLMWRHLLIPGEGLLWWIFVKLDPERPER